MQNIVFSGNWKIKVAQIHTFWIYKFLIEGSENSDGYYEGKIGTEVSNISGNQWEISIWYRNPLWNNDDSLWNKDYRPPEFLNSWRNQPSQQGEIQKLANYSVQEGLIIKLSVPNNIPEGVVGSESPDFSLVCNCLDSELNPIVPEGKISIFGIPEDILVTE